MLLSSIIRQSARKELTTKAQYVALNANAHCICCRRGSREICQGGSSNLGYVFVLVIIFYRGERGPYQHHLSGPPSARQRNAISMAFRWWADDGTQWFSRGIRTPCPPLDPRTCCNGGLRIGSYCTARST